MAPFRLNDTKKPQCKVGQWLGRVRQNYGLDLEEVAGAMSLRVATLQGVERGDFEELGERVYREHTLKSYADYLSVSWSDLSEEYGKWERQWSLFKTARGEKVVADNLRPIGRLTPRAFRNWFLLSGMGVVVAYLFLLGADALLPPSLTITSPESSGQNSNTTILTVTGKSQDASQIAVNGVDVIKSLDGHFTQTVILHDGLNTLTVMAKKKYSLPTNVIKTIVVATPEPRALAPEPIVTNDIN